MRDEFVSNATDCNIAAAAGGAGCSNFYQLMQLIVEANSISERLNKHIVCALIAVYC